MVIADIVDKSVLGLVGALVLFGVYLGFKRGFQRQSMKFVTGIIAFFFTLVIFAKIFPWFLSKVDGKQVSDILGFFGVELPGIAGSVAGAVEASIAAYILTIPMAIVLMPLGFVLVLLTIELILTIPYYFVCGIMGFTKYANTIITRILGAGVGALQGFLTACIILIPIAGAVGVAEEAISYIETTHPNSANTITISNYYRENFDQLNEDKAIAFVNKYFGSIYESFTHVEVDGEDVDIITVVDDSLELFVLYGDLSDTDFKTLSAENKATIDMMIEIEGRDPYMVRILSGAMRAAGKVFASEKSRLDFDPEIIEFFELLLNVFETSNEDNIGTDLRTLKSVYYLLCDSGALEQLDGNGQAAMFESFLKTDAEGKTVLDQLLSTLKANERFVTVSKGLNSLAMALVMKNLDSTGEVQETIEDVKGTLNDVLIIDKEGKTEEEYKSEVSSKLDETLQNNGIGLTEEQLAQVTDKVVVELEGKEEITDEDVAKFMAEYFNALAGNPSFGDGSDIVLPFPIP